MTRHNMFAVNSLIYRYVNSKEDPDILQKDLDQLCEWENKWQMTCNAPNCSLMRITKDEKAGDLKLNHDWTGTKLHQAYLGTL